MIRNNLIYSLHLIHFVQQHTELSKTVGQTQIKVGHCKGAQLTPEFLSVRVAVWEFSSSRLGRQVQCVRTAECADGAPVA